MVAFTFRMPAGIPGAYNRVGAGNTTEAGLLSMTATPAEFGHAVAYEPATGRYRAVTGTDTAAQIAGLLVRAYPAANVGSQTGGADPLGSVAPVPIGFHNIMKRGYMTITLRGTAAAAKGAPVNVRIATPGTNKVVGGLEATADAANTVAMPGGTWFFMGPADSLGNCEIAVNV